MPIYYVEQNGYAVSEVTTGSPGPDNSVENLANWPDTSIDLSKWYPGDDNRAPDQFIVGNSEIATPLDEAQRSLAGGVTGDRIQRFAIELRSILNGSQDEFATSGPVVDLSSTDYEWGMARIGVDKMRRLVYWEPVIVGEDILQFAVELNYIGQIFAYVVNREGIRLDYHVRHLSPEEAYDRQMYITGLLFPGIFMLNDKGARGFNSIRGDIVVMKGRANSDSSVGSSKSGALIELLDSLAPSATKAVRSDVFPLQFVLATQALYKTDRVDMSYFILNYLSKWPNVSKRQTEQVILSGLVPDWRDTSPKKFFKAEELYGFVYDLAISADQSLAVDRNNDDQTSYFFDAIVATTSRDVIVLEDAIKSLVTVGMVVVDRDSKGRVCRVRQKPEAKWFFDALKDITAS